MIKGKTKTAKAPTCVFCGKKNFKGRADFRGTTEICKNDMFTYAKCKNCGTINNISQKNVDYTNYAGGKKKFKLRTLRFIRFLKKNNISKKDKILDYGCGSGVFAKSLKEKGYNVQGYEPYNPKLKDTLKSNKKFSVVYLIQVFEHIPNFKISLQNLERRLLQDPK